MLHQQLVLAPAFALMVGLTGCSSITDPESTLLGVGGGRVTLAGANQLFDADSFERLNLVYELDPDNLRATTRVQEERCLSQQAGREKDPGFAARCEDVERRDLAEAFKAFYKYSQAPWSIEARRNQLQDRIMAASEQRCNLYKTYMRRHQSESDFWLGALTTVLGGVGALFTNKTAPRLFSGFAALTSGINAEYNQAYYSNLAAHVVIEGIERRREKYAKAIMAVRATRGSIGEYTVEAAVEDTVTYHGACSVIAGLQEASDSIKEVSNPGLRQFAETAVLFQQAQRALRNELTPDERTAVLANGRIPRVISSKSSTTAGSAGASETLSSVQAASAQVNLQDQYSTLKKWIAGNVAGTNDAQDSLKLPTGVGKGAIDALTERLAEAKNLLQAKQVCGAVRDKDISSAKAGLALAPSDPARQAVLEEASARARSEVTIPVNWIVAEFGQRVAAAKQGLRQDSSTVPTSLTTVLKLPTAVDLHCTE